jgi:hypothetical protein
MLKLGGLPSGKDRGKPVTIPTLPANPSTGPHISSAIRADLSKLNPGIAKHVREVADTK